MTPNDPDHAQVVMVSKAAVKEIVGHYFSSSSLLSSETEKKNNRNYS